jgi:ribosome-associated protein
MTDMVRHNTKDFDQADYIQKVKKIVRWLEEKQGKNIIGLDIHHKNTLTEALIIVSAVNYRHAQALTDWLLKKCAEHSIEFLGLEGYHPGSWILIDCNDVVVHIFQQEFREFYNIEGLWSESPRLFSEMGA